MLEFYYDFLDRYVDRRDFELIQMDTDSNYMAISDDKLEDIIRPEMCAEFEATKKQWLAWDKWSGRTPGLLKLESEGSGMIVLCSKCYFINGEIKKFSTKGMPKKKNEITWQRFKAALNGSIDTRWYSHRADRVSHSRRHNQQFFTNEAALGPDRQIIDNGLVRLGPIFNNLVDF